MCGSKLASGGRFLWFFYLWLLLEARILLFWVSEIYHFTCKVTLETILSAWGYLRGPRKDTWSPRTGFLLILSDLGSPFWVLFEVLWVKFRVFLERVSRSSFASNFGWDYWQLDLFKQGFRMEGIAKTMFPQKTFIGDSRVDFWCFLGALGSLFLDFSASETGLKIERFSRSP